MNYDLAIEGQEAKKPMSRNHGIAAMRYILALSVVLLHALPRPDAQTPAWAALIAVACRAAVPFFFIASGYFLSRRTGFSVDAVVKPLRRLVPIYLFWMAVYCVYFEAFVPDEWHWRLGDLLSGGAAFHLWFLPALALALVVVGVGLAVGWPVVTGIVCLLLWIFSLSRGAYNEVLHLPISAGRGGTLIAPIYVYAGAMISRRSISVTWRKAAFLVLASYTALLAEEGLNAWVTGRGFLISHDFLIATLPFGLCMFLLAKDLPQWQGWERLSKLGSVSLGVYASHVLFLRPLTAAIGNATPISVLVVAVTVSLAATLSSLLLRRVKYVGDFVQ